MGYKEELKKALEGIDESRFGKFTDNQLIGFEIISQKMRGDNNSIHKMKNNPFKNPEIQKQILQKNIGRKNTDKTKLKISKSHIGKKSHN